MFVNPVEIASRYEAGMGMREIAKQLGMPYNRVRSILRDLGVKIRTHLEAAKAAGPKISKANTGRKFGPCSEERKRKISLANQGKGKGYRIKNGYCVITRRGPNEGRGLHDVLMEERLGRSPLPSEIVHHDDENRQNNHPSNLIVMTRAEHSRLHRIRQRKGRKKQNQLTLNLNTQGY